MYKWTATLAGPTGTAYDGGQFELLVEFPIEYPFKAPKVKFLTKIYHPNVDEGGNMCVGILKSDAWKPSTKAQTSELTPLSEREMPQDAEYFLSRPVLLSIMQLLQEPNPDDALVASIGTFAFIRLDPRLIR